MLLLGAAFSVPMNHKWEALFQLNLQVFFLKASGLIKCNHRCLSLSKSHTSNELPFGSCYVMVCKISMLPLDLELSA